MKKEDKMNALEIINDSGGTVNTRPVLHNQVEDDYLAVIDCPSLTIRRLMEAGYTMSIHKGFLLLDKY